MYKGSRRKVEKSILYVAIASGGPSFILINIEAVDTAMMLMYSARFGGKRRRSSWFGYWLNYYTYVEDEGRG